MSHRCYQTEYLVLKIEDSESEVALRPMDKQLPSCNIQLLVWHPV